MFLKAWLFLSTLSLLRVFRPAFMKTCNGGNYDCHIFNWRPWGLCNGTCGHQRQIRERVFCCDVSVIPHNVPTCLRHCNMSESFELVQNKTCRVCENGGTSVSVSSPCKCTILYKGACCQGT